MRAQRVEIHAIRFQRCIQLHPLERLRGHRKPFVAVAVLLAQVAGLIEKTEIRSFDIEADSGDAALVRWEMRKNRREQKLDRARLGRESRHARDVEVRRFGTHQKIGVEIDRRVAAGGRIETDRNRRWRRRVEERVHAKRLRDVRVVGDKDLTEWHGLQRLLGGLAQDRRRPIADLLPGRRCVHGAGGISFRTDDIV